jgi:hypothetical protein
MWLENVWHRLAWFASLPAIRHPRGRKSAVNFISSSTTCPDNSIGKIPIRAAADVGMTDGIGGTFLRVGEGDPTTRAVVIRQPEGSSRVGLLLAKKWGRKGRYLVRGLVGC